jgi:cytochrome c oxidase assembly factor CtaG
MTQKEHRKLWKAGGRQGQLYQVLKFAAEMVRKQSFISASLAGHFFLTANFFIYSHPTVALSLYCSIIYILYIICIYNTYILFI